MAKRLYASKSLSAAEICRSLGMFDIQRLGETTNLSGRSERLTLSTLTCFRI